MAKEGLKGAVKRELIRAALERSQSVDLEKFGAPKAADAVSYDNVEEILNVPYMNRDEIPLAMDIFKPIVPEGTELPVMVTIHGGGLTLGDRKISRPFGRVLASKGYLVFSIEYRLAPRANVCMELDDICAGLDLVGRKLVDYDVDFSRIFMAAESAGAYLAAYVSAMKGSKKLQEAIGYEPTRVSFKAIGLISGMLYTNRNDPNGWTISEQIYGDKRTDENFLQYMNPEHPEIINNLPPTYLITGRGDFLNHYSIMMHEALKRAGRPCRLAYYGDRDLEHAFPTMKTEDPRSIAAIDRMLAWFEEQARASAGRERNAKTIAARAERYETARDACEKDNEKLYQYIMDLAAVYPDRKYAPAIIDCSRTYTYAQMFEEWEKYARVFTGLGIGYSNKSRVALAGTISAEPLFAYYALNMTGAVASMFSYPDFLPGGRWRTMIEKEHITDLIVSDIMVTPQLWTEIREVRKKNGLRNVILLHTRMGGPCTGYAEMFYNEFNYHALKRIPDVVYMEDLIGKYRDVKIRKARKSGDQICVIVHTSGTSNGTRKPLPFTDRMINNIASTSPDRRVVDRSLYKTNVKVKYLVPFDFSASSMINGIVNASFSEGNTLVLTFFGFMHPKFVLGYRYYGIEVAFSSGFMIDGWMKIPDLPDDAFSTLKVTGIAGSYVPPSKAEKYEAFLREHGFRGYFLQSYGMSELAGAMLKVPKGCREDILGYPEDVDSIRILDEDDGKFYRTDAGVRTGVLYCRTSSMCLNELDGELLFELTEIDGRNFICTQDLVRVNEDGSLSYAGRSNQFFQNNAGVRFEAGTVQTLLSAQPAIDTVAVVPAFEKRIHDTVPVLYVIPAEKGPGAPERIRAALAEVFVRNERLRGSILPSQFVIVDDIPCNTNGKVDVYSITRSRLKGSAYNIIPVKDGDELTDVRIESTEQLSSFTAGTLPEGMGRDSAFGLYDIFSVPRELTVLKSLKGTAARIREEKEKTGELGRELGSKLVKKLMPGLEIGENGVPKVPDKLMKLANDMNGMMYDQDIISCDFEE